MPRMSSLQSLLYVLIFCSCVLTNAYSQDSITTGVPYTVIDGQYKTYYEKDGKLLAVKVESKRIFIQLFDTQTLKLIRRIHFDLSRNQVLERITEINKHYFIFYSVFNRKEKNVYLYCKEINIESASVMDERFILKSKSPLYSVQSLNAETFGSYVEERNSDNMPVFNFDYSQDKSKVCVHYRCSNTPFNSIGIHIFDQNLAVISAKEIEVSSSISNSMPLDYAVDRSGTLYMAWNIYNDSVPWFKRNTKSESVYRTSVFIFPWNANSVTIYDIELPNKQISRLRFIENSKDYLSVAGFYHVGATPVCIKGIFSSSINENTGKLNRLVCHDIPDDVLNPYQNSNEKSTSFSRPYFEDLVLKKVFGQEDNSIVLIGEQVYDIEKTKSYPEEQLQIDLNHHFNDVFVVKIDSLGGIKWMKRLPKRQVGGKDKGGMSYRHLMFSGEHYFMFLDNAKNSTLLANVRPTKHLNEQGGYLTYYKIDDLTGQVSKVNLFNVRYINGYSLHQFSSNRITKINEKEFVLEFYKKDNEDILVKVELR